MASALRSELLQVHRARRSLLSTLLRRAAAYAAARQSIFYFDAQDVFLLYILSSKGDFHSMYIVI